MLDLLSALYPWTKAFHVISMTAWMAGMFYMPRLFVYHAERAPVGSETSEIFKVMERKLLRLIINPSMVATWVFGLMLLFTPGIVSWSVDFWIYPKLAAVLLLTWMHHWMVKRWKDFLNDENTRSGRHYRLMNEVPTLALVVIVIMVIVRPI
ncbi:protoporphyrinogen oxidase HemJ [Amaricoccus macauensis]|uniref:protoporphyrinogen oxidase HemJ n=1 Tax=Amaricoccus macauensis TaxID=57001 RepID=UPI003C7EA591